MLGYTFKSTFDDVFSNYLHQTRLEGLNEGAKPFNERTTMLPAVGIDGNGYLAELKAYVSRGSGKVYVRIDTENPILNPDTQTSVRLALNVARQVANRDTSNVNLYYDLVSPSGVVGGKSAGAALAITTIALLRNESLRKDALITGTLEPDEKGTIGKVNGIFLKAKAAKNAGYKTLLVPIGTSIERGVNVEKVTNIQIIEVNDILEAYEQMREK